MPKLACWSCGRQIYTVAPLDVAVRRGAALSALRRLPARRSTRVRATSLGSPPEPADRPGSARGGGRAAAGRPPDGAATRRPAVATRPRVRARRARRFRRLRADRRFDRARAPGRSRRPHAWTIAAWSPTGGGPAQAAADGVIDRAAATPPDALADADLVVLAAPPTACLAALDDLAGPWQRCCPRMR